MTRKDSADLVPTVDAKSIKSRKRVVLHFDGVEPASFADFKKRMREWLKTALRRYEFKCTDIDWNGGK